MPFSPGIPVSRLSMNWRTRTRLARVIQNVIRTCSSCSTLESMFTRRSMFSTLASRSDTVRQITGVASQRNGSGFRNRSGRRNCSCRSNSGSAAALDWPKERFISASAQNGQRKNFFRESNLTALREMALRVVAEHVDRDLREIMSEEKMPGPWKSGDRLLVAVSASP